MERNLINTRFNWREQMDFLIHWNSMLGQCYEDFWMTKLDLDVVTASIASYFLQEVNQQRAPSGFFIIMKPFLHFFSPLSTMHSCFHGFVNYKVFIYTLEGPLDSYLMGRRLVQIFEIV